MKSEETFFKYPDFNNIKEIIYNSVEKYPNNIAFKYKEITYKKLLEEANNLGTGLYNLGLKGKKVAIISKNRYEYALSYVSILLGGMVAVPLDKDFTEIELKNALIRKSGRCNYI